MAHSSTYLELLQIIERKFVANFPDLQQQLEELVNTRRINEDERQSLLRIYHSTYKSDTD